MFKVEKRQVTRYILELECFECNVRDSFVIGYNFLNRKQALNLIPTTEWNGWDISNREKPLCAACRMKKFRKKDRGVK